MHTARSFMTQHRWTVSFLYLSQRPGQLVPSMESTTACTWARRTYNLYINCDLTWREMVSIRFTCPTCATHRLIFRFFFTGRWKKVARCSVSQPTNGHARSRCKCFDFLHRFLTLIHLYVSQFLTTGPEWEVSENHIQYLLLHQCYIFWVQPLYSEKVYSRVKKTF